MVHILEKFREKSRKNRQKLLAEKNLAKIKFFFYQDLPVMSEDKW